MDCQDLLSYGNRSSSPSYWCYNCHVPLIQESCGLCGEKGVILSKKHFRSVFKEELSLIKKYLNKDVLSQIEEKFPLEIFSLSDVSLWVSYTAGLNSVVLEQKVDPLDLLKAYYIKIRDEVHPLEAYHRAMSE